MSETVEKIEDLPNGWESRLVKDILVIEDGDRGSNYPKKSDFTKAGFCLFLNTKNVRPEYAGYGCRKEPQSFCCK